MLSNLSSAALSITAVPAFTADNFSSIRGNGYCPKFVDEYSNSWPLTRANNVASIPCSEYLNRNTFVDSSDSALKECLTNGTWSIYTNFTACLSKADKENSTFARMGARNSSSRSGNGSNGGGSIDLGILLYYVGYSVSILSLTLALVILSYFKSLRCTRNIIHCHLIVTFIMSDIMWIVMHLVHVNYKMMTKENLALACNFISVLYTYFYTANFFWMFAEGVFMYQMVVIGFTQKILPFRYFLTIGWGIPFAIIFSWAVTNAVKHSNMCLVHIAKYNTHYIYATPIFIVLALNFIIFLLVIKLLIEKVFFSKAGGSINYLKSFKGFVFLIPHLGITYLITIHGFRFGGSYTYNKILMPLLLSSQGFFVALYCCFMNKEVKVACTTEMKHMENRRKSSGTTASILLPGSATDLSSLPYLLKRFSIISNVVLNSGAGVKRPSIQSEASFIGASNGKDHLLPNGGSNKAGTYSPLPLYKTGIIDEGAELSLLDAKNEEIGSEHKTKNFMENEQSTLLLDQGCSPKCGVTFVDDQKLLARPAVAPSLFSSQLGISCDSNTRPLNIDIQNNFIPSGGIGMRKPIRWHRLNKPQQHSSDIDIPGDLRYQRVPFNIPNRAFETSDKGSNTSASLIKLNVGPSNYNNGSVLAPNNLQSLYDAIAPPRKSFSGHKTRHLAGQATTQNNFRQKFVTHFNKTHNFWRNAQKNSAIEQDDESMQRLTFLQPMPEMVRPTKDIHQFLFQRVPSTLTTGHPPDELPLARHASTYTLQNHKHFDNQLKNGNFGPLTNTPSFNNDINQNNPFAQPLFYNSTCHIAHQPINTHPPPTINPSNLPHGYVNQQLPLTPSPSPHSTDSLNKNTDHSPTSTQIFQLNINAYDIEATPPKPKGNLGHFIYKSIDSLPQNPAIPTAKMIHSPATKEPELANTLDLSYPNFIGNNQNDSSLSKLLNNLDITENKINNGYKTDSINDNIKSMTGAYPVNMGPAQTKNPFSTNGYLLSDRRRSSSLSTPSYQSLKSSLSDQDLQNINAKIFDDNHLNNSHDMKLISHFLNLEQMKTPTIHEGAIVVDSKYNVG